MTYSTYKEIFLNTFSINLSLTHISPKDTALEVHSELLTHTYSRGRQTKPNDLLLSEAMQAKEKNRNKKEQIFY